MNYDSVILDIDGTIWNTTPIVAVSWNNAIKNLGLNVKPVTAEILQKEFGKTMDIIARDLWPELSGPDRDNLLETCCKNEQADLIKNQKDITYPDVIKTVRELSSKIDFYVVSNCHAGYIELMLDKTDLKTCVKDFVCFGDNGFSKAENIKLIVQRNHLKNPVYVGDTQGDCDSCVLANVQFIWASYGFGTADKFSHKIENFAQIKDILQKKL